MATRWTAIVVCSRGIRVGYVVADRQSTVQGQSGSRRGGFSAVPAAIGALDVTGPYDVVADWPKDISTLPGNEKWTWGAGQGVFAESPDRVYVVQRGQLPVLAGIQGTALPQVAPNLSFPVMGLLRNATQASPPGALEVNGKVGDDSDAGKAGVDFLWENCIVVIDRNGNIIETLEAVGQDAAAAAFGVHQPVRSPEERLGRGRLPSRHLQVHQRREDAAADHRRAERACLGRQALLSSDVHGMAA